MRGRDKKKKRINIIHVFHWHIDPNCLTVRSIYVRPGRCSCAHATLKSNFVTFDGKYVEVARGVVVLWAASLCLVSVISSPCWQTWEQRVPECLLCLACFRKCTVDWSLVITGFRSVFLNQVKGKRNVICVLLCLIFTLVICWSHDQLPSSYRGAYAVCSFIAFMYLHPRWCLDLWTTDPNIARLFRSSVG